MPELLKEPFGENDGHVYVFAVPPSRPFLSTPRVHRRPQRRRLRASTALFAKSAHAAAEAATEAAAPTDGTAHT